MLKSSIFVHALALVSKQTLNMHELLFFCQAKQFQQYRFLYLYRAEL